MNSTIYLSCLVVIIGSLTWTVQGSFESDSARLVDVFKKDSAHSISDSDVDFLETFLDKYGDRIQLTPEQRTQANDIVRQYNAEKANQTLVDGVPRQGGGKAKLAKKIAIYLAADMVVDKVINLFKW
ncbi:protein Turandot M-like [Drosophila kikkawai]|uniref:Protein Turandot M-like n=1 Tax=Drosophila kikkawai TaxID=30033 RepID=A0A6P4I1F1_DROKI|nr:protein Turandot M-like [Drosophila kikkawai]